MKKSFTPKEVASALLRDAGLSEWETGFLALALEEVAEWAEHIDRNSIMCCDCLDELTQMNSQHRISTEAVAHALTGLSFSVSWQGSYGSRIFVVNQHQKHDVLPHVDFVALYDKCGWGSDAHRQALRALFNA